MMPTRQTNDKGDTLTAALAHHEAGVSIPPDSAHKSTPPARPASRPRPDNGWWRSPRYIRRLLRQLAAALRSEEARRR
jgi:hypothetical protein